MTDLIDELLQSAKQTSILGDITFLGAYGLKKYELDVDASLATKIHKAKGHYVTIKVNDHFLWSSTIRRYICRQLSHTISAFLEKFDLPPSYSALVVGLGNGNMVCDSLGKLVCNGLYILNHDFYEHFDTPYLSYITPSVQGVTGVNSFDIIDAIIRKIRPNVVLAVDSLCATNVERLGTTFQLSDAGVSPGAGVGNGQNILSMVTLGVPVLSIGVPLMIGAADLGVYAPRAMYMHYTPKEIDYVIKCCANIISSAINTSVYPKNILNTFAP